MRIFVFLAGFVLGVFGLLTAQNLGLFRVRGALPPPRDVPQTGGEDAEGQPVRPEGVSELAAALARALRDPQGKNLDELAILLEEAIFDRDWRKVQAAAETIRAHGAEWVTPAVAPPPAPVEERPLVVQAHEMQRKLEDAALARRRNRATVFSQRTDRQAIGELILLLGTEQDETVRLDAARLLARSGDESALRALIAALRSPQEAARFAAGRALAMEGYLAGAEALAEIVRSDADPALRESAVASLGRYEALVTGEPHPAVQALLEALKGDPSPQVRRTAASVLSRADLHGMRPLAEGLSTALEKDASAEVRIEAVRSLARYSAQFGAPPPALEAATRALRSERNEKARDAILAFLGDHGERETLAAIDAFAATPEARENSDALRAAREAIRGRVEER